MILNDVFFAFWQVFGEVFPQLLAVFFTAGILGILIYFMTKR